MTQARHEYGPVSRLQAEALGQPGSRRFRLLVESRDGRSAVLWLEKEQLFNLSVAIKRIVATVEGEVKGRASKERRTQDISDAHDVGGAPLEFQVGQLAVGYDERTALYLIAAHTVDEPESAPATLSLMATEQVVENLAEEAFKVCAAGRPQCFLCGGPLVPEPHICPRHNGHALLGT
ncbi:MAG: DUF3090 family protein [Chloroflexi bacterium]|nr:DUF3090 family protein [Chloroflexota bacterium]